MKLLFCSGWRGHLKKLLGHYSCSSEQDGGEEEAENCSRTGRDLFYLDVTNRGKKCYKIFPAPVSFLALDILRFRSFILCYHISLLHIVLFFLGMLFRYETTFPFNSNNNEMIFHPIPSTSPLLLSFLNVSVTFSFASLAGEQVILFSSYPWKLH